MQLNIKNRIVLLGLLPAEGDITTLKIVRQLREALSFTEQEHEDCRIVQSGGQITWNPEADPKKDIPIGSKARKVIEDAFTKANQAKKLTADHIDLYELFFPTEDADDRPPVVH